MLEQVKEDHLVEDLKINVLQAIYYIIKEGNKFLTILDEDIIYDISDDQIIKELVSMFNSDNSNKIENKDKTDD
ncbi:10309_t:CDS:2, partial [Cetraspora pellucida]